MTKTILRGAVFGGVLGLLAGVAASVAVLAAPENAEVKIDNFTFAPQSVTVKAGTTITWINEDDIPHTVAATGKAFKSKVLDTDDKFSFTFTTAGTYEYFCSLHPHMTGTIVVEGAGGGGAAP
jgi:amicyanin